MLSRLKRSRIGNLLANDERTGPILLKKYIPIENKKTPPKWQGF
ncbi:MAG: hypothetical protein ACJAZW_000965 [Maritalea sp.]|jgi:hypothetical protein